MHEGLSPRAYEEAVVERFRTLFPRPAFDVRHDIKMPGQASGARRQVDVAIYETGGSKPILLVEVKRHARAVDLVSSGATIALVRDIGKAPAVMVSIAGFSRAAQHHLLWEGIEHMTITSAEAKGLRWIPLIEQRFGLDRWFREVSGDLFEAMRVRNPAPFLDCDIPYEEWVATIEAGLAAFPEQAADLLRFLAERHPDDGVRFNAVQMLIEDGRLDPAEAARLLRMETDPDVQLLLEDALDR
nr:hypothetical protein [Sphingomonas sp. SCN 67-18]